jgi:tetratricopeptide (TPR) repeat protein
MENKRLIHLIVSVIILAVLVFFTSCVPPADSTEDARVSGTAVEPEIDRDKCDLYLNFAYSYYQNQNWHGTIKNYKKMMEYGCQKEYAQDIYSYYGRAYQQLAKTDPVYYDSALYVYLEGQKYLPDDIYIHKNIAYIYHIQGKADLEIRQYEKMLEIAPEDIDLYRSYIKLCFAQERYEDMLWGIEKLLEIKPNDEQAINDRLIAYEKLGKDITTVRREQWERNPDNVRFGMEYAEALTEQLEYDKAIEVYKKVTRLDLRNEQAWAKLADLYKTLGRYAEASSVYEHINKNIDPLDLEVIDNIAKMRQNLTDFSGAYNWAKKAIAIGNSSLAYKIRGDLFYAAAEYYSSSRQLNFEDKLVYKLAYDDYLEAYKLGDYSVKSRIDFLKEYMIPKREDWFMNKIDASGKERTVYRPRLECYSWIDINVKQN